MSTLVFQCRRVTLSVTGAVYVCIYGGLYNFAFSHVYASGVMCKIVYL